MVPRDSLKTWDLTLLNWSSERRSSLSLALKTMKRDRLALSETFTIWSAQSWACLHCKAPLLLQAFRSLLKRRGCFYFLRNRCRPAPADVLPWSPQSVWDSLVAVIVDQLGLELDEVSHHARFKHGGLAGNRRRGTGHYQIETPANPGFGNLGAASRRGWGTVVIAEKAVLWKLPQPRSAKSRSCCTMASSNVGKMPLL